MTTDPHRTAPLVSTDPRTGTTTPTGLHRSSPKDVARVVADAHRAAPLLAAMHRHDRATLLDAMAARLELAESVLVTTAMTETGLPEARIRGELARTTFQLRLFAEAVREGGHLEATIDHARDTPLGAAPDIRRMLIPLGPAAVFGASNFPLAFSVPGGDTASALATGCPVVVKAHDSHLLTSQAAYEALRAAVADTGAPEGTIGIVFGREAGIALVSDPRIKAVGFTGSPRGGRALLDIVNSREEPIPFYGELGSLNPVVVTPGAAQARPEAIAAGLAQSVTGSAGQLCTKPGLVFVPAGAPGDRLVELLGSAVAEVPAQVLLNRHIADSYAKTGERLTATDAVTAVASGGAVHGEGCTVTPQVLTTDADSLGAVLEECFGPLVVVVRHDGDEALRSALAQLPGSLTATVHAEPHEEELLAGLVPVLTRAAGRLVFNGYPTGVRVSWAQHHGGPWPATNSVHTSVGVFAMRRFLRPQAWQDAPTSLLPVELRDDCAGVPRRVDGVMTSG
ncbi:aldehyde dehydrogenase (NADP(+)) [Streptomyces sp. NA04227]|uniref:aldehyde dehydrogenase (NADP(+)) n=1 Tax=Streptomyces sp. NA04227 TaxID=2742136 RepID=UPI0015924AAF|nr:aldehyde dehydrogenase (NADP(+)) [Streptomyces sp. NA04227]QKW10364.1 aldehyde dehydrogenase (NADP(+)) [Streptomyces sp. NA04227]